MSTIAGIDANGRITPKGVNVVIPPQSAGIGDLIYKYSNTDFIVIGRGTADAPNIIKNGKPYTCYGAIYGFVGGEAMIVAPIQYLQPWGEYKNAMPIYPRNTILMRNGLYTDEYATLSIKRNGDISGGSSAPVILTSGLGATSLTKSTYDSNASEEVKARFGTWEEYVGQTMRVNGAYGTPFGATAPDVKVHEFGRWFGRTFGASQDIGTGLRSCYDYRGCLGTDIKGTWWLPSMFELAEITIDEHMDKLKENPNSIFLDFGLYNSYGSCVLVSNTNAYNAYCTTFSSSWANISTTDHYYRPVSLFKLY